ncbi:hypothetical protein Leryth_017581 [Lithospermum erythrorhizon]|nr:hypothetical protein Leryth_017581 [Lithospermum erythrorhizon]
MHGRPRKDRSEEEQQASANKAKQLRSLQSQFLQFHHSKTFTKEALEVSAKLLKANPEHYTAWNYRKLAVEDLLNESGAEIDSETIKSILEQELRLVEDALRKNYKSYGAWHHRKWVLSKGQSSTDHELLLLNQLQKADARNFHAWNYRRFITGLKNIPNEEELQYTTDMIDDNFSNYSAWHNRSVILSQLSEKRAEGYFPKKDVLVKEYDFVRDALFIDPDDQSGWFYHFWLIDQTTKEESLSVFSWPPHGSGIYVSKDGSNNNSNLSPFFNYQSCARTLPLILYFSEPVNGVNSSTVIVEDEYGANVDLTWTPLSTDTKSGAQAWVAYLNLPEDKLPASISYQVNVSLGNSEGIVSFSGIKHCQPLSISFTVHAPSYKSEYEGLNKKRVSWHEECFYVEETEVKNYNLRDFFHALNLNQDRKLVSGGCWRP